MISFELTPEQIGMCQRLRKLAKEKIQPVALELDSGPPGPVDKGFLKIIADEGLNKLIVPKEYGGENADWVTLALATEEISYGCAGLASIYAATVHSVSTILIGGTPEQKAEFLPLLLESGGAVASFMSTEEKGGSDLTSCETTARLEGDCFVINGRKMPIINAADAAFYIVWATTDATRGYAGINAFIIPRGTPGITFAPYDDKAGLRNTPTCTVYLNNVVIPKSNLLGIPGSGYLLLAETLDLGRAFFGAICVGLARSALEEAIDYAKNRLLRGRPIFKNQGVNFLLVDIATKLEAARLLVWRACRLMDLKEDYSRESSMAKLSASECAYQAGCEGMQIFGKKALMRPSLMEKLHRDAITLRTVEGTNIIQKVIIASQL